MATVVAPKLDRVADFLAPGVSLNSHAKNSPPWVSPSTPRGASIGSWNSTSVAKLKHLPVVLPQDQDYPLSSRLTKCPEAYPGR